MRAIPKGFLWFFSVTIGLFSLAVVLMTFASSIGEAAPHLVHYAASHALPLYVHMIGGSLALILMPFQFWMGLRNRFRRAHRFIGYTYVVSVCLASAGSLMLLPRFAGSAWATAGFALLAVLWVATTVRAVLHARAGRTADHRAWMMRSAALTFAAVVLRLMLLPLMGAGLTLTESYDVTAWASWIVPLIAVEVMLRRGRGRAAAPAS